MKYRHFVIKQLRNFFFGQRSATRGYVISEWDLPYRPQ